MSEIGEREVASARVDETARTGAARGARRRWRRSFRAGLLLVFASAGAGAGPGDALAEEALTARGAALFAKYCATCHGDRAQGYAADHAPSLATSTFQASVTDEFLRAAVERGRPGTEMAGYGKEVGGPLDDGQVAALIAFLRANAPAERVTLSPSAGGARNVGTGLGIYYQACASCHGTETRRATAPHLFNPFFLETASDGFLRYAIAHGRPGTQMQAFAGTLTDAEIDDVVAYLRSAAPDAGTLASAGGSGGGEAAAWQRVVLNPGGRQADLRPRGHLVPMAQVKQALDEKRRIVVVDARSPSDWRLLRIPGAVSLPYYDLSGIDRLPKDGTWIVAYCACPHHLAGIVVEELRKRGYEHSAVLDEGILAWQEAGYPIEAATGAPSGASTRAQTSPSDG